MSDMKPPPGRTQDAATGLLLRRLLLMLHGASARRVRLLGGISKTSQIRMLAGFKEWQRRG